MKRVWNYFFGARRRPVVVDVGRVFGERLEWKQVESALRNRREDPLFRALGQLLACQRELCPLAVADKSNLPNAQTAYEAGAVGCAADVMALLMEIEAGRCRDAQVRAWFGGGKEAETEEK